jgi:hypothetical protein
MLLYSVLFCRIRKGRRFLTVLGIWNRHNVRKTICFGYPEPYAFDYCLIILHIRYQFCYILIIHSLNDGGLAKVTLVLSCL